MCARARVCVCVCGCMCVNAPRRLGFRLVSEDQLSNQLCQTVWVIYFTGCM